MNINDCFNIDVINEQVNNIHVNICPNDTLEIMLANSIHIIDDIQLSAHLHIKDPFAC